MNTDARERTPRELYELEGIAEESNRKYGKPRKETDVTDPLSPKDYAQKVAGQTISTVDKEAIELRVRLEKETVKDALKEGLKEWMTERFTEVGRWTIRAALIAVFAGLIYFVLMLSGWHGPK